MTSLPIPRLLRLLLILSGLNSTILRAAEPPLRVIEAKPVAELNQLFTREEGWIGADGNYSVPLSNERTLWLFSDTWLGKVAAGRRVKPVMINNSVGVQTHVPDGPKVEFHWAKTTERKPAALIRPADEQGWFWPFAGIAVDDRVHLFLHQMEKTKEEGAFGFRTVAIWHGELANPLDPPAKWQVTQRKLPHAGVSDERRILWGSSLLRHGDDIYIYGTEERPQEFKFGRRMILARVPEASLGEFEKWQFWTADGWHSDVRRVKPLVHAIASEYSVTYLPAFKQFVTVTNDAFLSPKIIARFAEQPWGEWSEPLELYSCPEAMGSKSVFCYSGKAHPQLAGDDELVLTYAANSFQFVEVINDAKLYWPRFVRIKLAKKP